MSVPSVVAVKQKPGELHLGPGKSSSVLFLQSDGSWSSGMQQLNCERPYSFTPKDRKFTTTTFSSPYLFMELQHQVPQVSKSFPGELHKGPGLYVNFILLLDLVAFDNCHQVKIRQIICCNFLKIKCSIVWTEPLWLSFVFYCLLAQILKDFKMIQKKLMMRVLLPSSRKASQSTIQDIRQPDVKVCHYLSNKSFILVLNGYLIIRGS